MGPDSTPGYRSAAVRRAIVAIALGLLAACVIAYLAYAAVYAAYARSLLAFPFDYDQGEGFELYDAVLLAQGRGIYLDNGQYPFYSSNYPPMFRLLLAPLVAVFGPHIWVGRALGLATSLVCGAAIFVASRRLWFDGVARPATATALDRALGVAVPAVAALAFYASNYVYWIGPLARAHIPMVMFSLLAAAVLDRAATTRGWITGFALLMAAGYTKLQAVDVIGAGFLFALIQRPRAFAAGLAACAAATGAVVLALNAATGGQFWLNVVLANVNEYDLQRTWQYYAEWYRLHSGLIWLAAAYVVWDAVRAVRARSLKPVTIWSWWFLANVAIVGMLTGKWGAGPTYLISAVACACVCAVGIAARLAAIIRARSGETEAVGLSRAFAAGFLSLVLLYQATLNVHLPTGGRVLGGLARLLGVPAGASSYPPYPYYDSVGYTQLGHLLDDADIANGWDLARRAREAAGPVLSEEAMLVLNAGKDVVTNPTQLLNLSKNGMLDTDRLLQMIRDRAFGLVIFRAQFYPNDVLIEIGRQYTWCAAVRMNGFDYQVLCPRTP